MNIMNEKVFINSQSSFFDTVIRYMKAGIIHSKRQCDFCDFPMKLGYYGWVDKAASYEAKYKI